MKKIVYSMFIIMILFICSMSLVSCDAITAQNINIDSAGGMNGGQRMDDNTRNDGNLMGGMTNADLMGKIIYVDGNSIKIELIKQTQNDKSSNSNDGKQDLKDNQNNNKQSQRGFPGSMPDMNYTGTYKILTVNDDVDISQGLSMERKNEKANSKSDIKVSDLKKDQIIMIWYKQNTEIVERISVVHS